MTFQLLTKSSGMIVDGSNATSAALNNIAAAAGQSRLDPQGSPTFNRLFLLSINSSVAQNLLINTTGISANPATFTTAAQFHLTCTSSPTTNFGLVLSILLDNALNATLNAADFGAIWETSTSGSEIAAFIVRTFSAGNVHERARYDINGLTVTGGVTVSTTTLMSTSVALANGAGALAGTLTNAPAAGNPTKWISINDNGTTRRIPAW